VRLSPLVHSNLDHHGFAHHLINTNVPEVSISSDQANHFGFLSAFASLDNPTSNALTQKVLDWHPERPGLIQDLGEGHYFNA
jgi:hypothetical protein